MPNRLAGETSPYLLQHRDNPVDWFPWGDEPFELAASTDRPVLLSIGYSTCHWCHVMERESFENEETAAMMNRLFVSIKVDREERPDVDSIYMEAVQAMTGRGGWPMTVFLTPTRKPFYAGTYFPDADRHGMPSFRRVMGAVADAWQNRRDELTDQADDIAAAIGRTLPPGAEVPGRQAVLDVYLALVQRFDERNGGFGGAPKFPQEPMLEFLLRVAGQAWAPEAERMLTITLEHMAAGGIRDHVGGGFSRYAVDDVWLVPHFEKMLYNNAELARIYLRAWQLTGVEGFRIVAGEILDYLRRDMTHPDGGIYSAEDADSEGHEGKFYTFSHDELATAAGDETTLAAAAFGTTAGGNFEGSNIIHRPVPVEELADRFARSVDEVEETLARVRLALFDMRATRVRPGRDDKVITEWNGLALRAFAEAGAVLDDHHLLEAARNIGRFARSRLMSGDRLVRSWAKGRSGGPALLADHAALAVGLFSLYAATGETEWFEFADRLVADMKRDHSGDLGVVYATSRAVDDLITRPTDQQDNPTASGASVAAEAFRVHHAYTGDPTSMDEYLHIVRAAAALFDRAPLAIGHLAGVHATHLAGITEVALVGSDAQRFARSVWDRYRPEVVLAVDPAGNEGSTVPLLAGRSVAGRTVAYVCEERVCSAPVESVEELATLL